MAILDVWEVDKFHESLVDRYGVNQLARLLGVSRQTVWLWRKGTHRPSHKNWVKMRKLEDARIENKYVTTEQA